MALSVLLTGANKRGEIEGRTGRPTLSHATGEKGKWSMKRSDEVRL